jgi:proline iminopeptidase
MSAMPTFTASDGTRLAYRDLGQGPDVVCLPGGPMRAGAYLGDLGGLSARFRLIIPDLRGSGDSALPADLASCRCDRLVGDVEALREHLGLKRLSLLGHSAGANLAVRYVERYPDRVARLVLVTPSTRAIGLAATGEQRREILGLRQGEPWYPQVSAAFERIAAGRERDGDWALTAPMFYGRWDEAAKAHEAAEDEQQRPEVAAASVADGAFNPPATRAALAAFGSPVLLLAGEVDVSAVPALMAEYASLFRRCELVVQPGAGHYPWLDDASRAGAVLTPFLERSGG